MTIFRTTTTIAPFFIKLWCLPFWKISKGWHVNQVFDFLILRHFISSRSTHQSVLFWVGELIHFNNTCCHPNLPLGNWGSVRYTRLQFWVTTLPQFLWGKLFLLLLFSFSMSLIDLQLETLLRSPNCCCSWLRSSIFLSNNFDNLVSLALITMYCH